MNKKLLLGLLLTSFFGSGFAAQDGVQSNRTFQEIKVSKKLQKRLQKDIDLADFFSRCEGGARITTLYIACLEGHKDVAEFLLKNDTINNANELSFLKGVGYGPLWKACVNGHKNVVKFLLRSGIIKDVDQGRVEPEGQTSTPLYGACFEGHEEVVKILLKSGTININKGRIRRDGTMMTPLDAARKKGHEKIIDILLQNGVDKI
ncbi:ankyrin repeat domain-containing protein [Candidatus Babeliales bacterium]|nr:ankyrin repeat domain-containing protein [Candidatus Babeliales bacterium]